MERAHVIETLSFELAFASEAEANALHMRLGDFLAGRGLAIIDEVFGEFSNADEVVRLDRIEVDLGEAPVAWDEAVAELQLREALRRALRDAMDGPEGRAGAAQREADPSRLNGTWPLGSRAEAARSGRALAELDLIWAHLHHGLLPWSADQQSHTAFDELVLRVVAHSGEVLAARLSASPARARLIARLVRQWPQPAVEQLARRLSRPGAEVAADGLGAPGGRPAEAWERRLQALVGDSAPAASDPAAPLAVATFHTDAGWARLLQGDAAAVRARLASGAKDPAWRRALAGALNRERQQDLLSLWRAGDDTDFIIALIGQSQAWRLGVAASADEVGLVLREGLVAALAETRGALAVDGVVASLVAARARIDGLAPQRIAQSLARTWPASDPTVRARLQAALVSRFGVLDRTPGPTLNGASNAVPDSPPSRSEAAPRGWRFETEPRTEGAAASEGAWRARLEREPSGLAAYLLRQGRIAAWRRRLARDLTPARLAEVLSLWLSPDEAALVAALVEDETPWRLGSLISASRPAPALAAPDLAVRLRGWLLDTLLLAEGADRSDAEAVVLGLVRRRAEHEDLVPEDVAIALAEAWPDAGPLAVHRGRLRRILEVLRGSATPAAAARAPFATEAAPAPPATPAPPAPPAPEHADLRRRLEAALATREVTAAEPLLRTALIEDRVGLQDVLLRARGADPALPAALAGQLPAALLFELAQPWLSEAEVRLVLAAAPPPEAGRKAGQAFWAALLNALWAPPAIGATGLLRRLLRSSDASRRPATMQAVRARRGYIVGELAAGPAATSQQGAPPALAPWRGRLPERPTAPTRRALAAILTPASAGLSALAALDEAERRDLIGRIRPADGAKALGAIDALTAAARAAALREPADTWSAFGWRFVLRELFEEGRAFHLAGFARRWFDAWLAAGPPVSATQARLALALAVERGDGARIADDGPGEAGVAADASRPTAEARATEAGPQSEPRRPPSTPGPPHDPSSPASTIPPAPATASASPDPSSTASPPGAVQATPETTPPASLATGNPPASPSWVPESARPAEPIATAHPPDPLAFAAALRQELHVVAAEPRSTGATPDAPDAETEAEAEPERDDTLYVANAGIVLAGPYIPMLFSRLGLTEGRRFVDNQAVERATHLLQFMVDGAEEPALEHRLTLNKLLCGLDLVQPVDRDFRITDAERDAIESLLKAMIQRWTIIGRTSVAGLRESFFQRQGALTLEPEAWRLRVEPRSFDMLIDQIPWGFATLKLPWMAQVLHVDWR